MRERIFCYGTLQFPEVMTFLIGGPLSREPARIDGYARRWMRDGPWPGLVPMPGSTVRGTCIEVDSTILQLLDRYEGEEYERVTREVHTNAAILSAWVYLPKAGLATEREWDPGQFAREHLQEYLEDIRREGSSSANGGGHGGTGFGA
jgi:gamma-glutamylcyclotransferase (GGCT)/AIG2-like uncharacterized protein YtfP